MQIDSNVTPTIKPPHEKCVAMEKCAKKKFDKMVGEEVLSKRISDIFLFRNKTKLFP